MKRKYIYSIVLSIVTFVVVMTSLTGCDKLLMHDDDCVVIMDSAALDLHDMDYAAATQKLRRVLTHTGNKMHKMSADLFMMRISIQLSKNKDFYDYRNDAEQCMHSLNEEAPYFDDVRMLVWHYVQSSYYRISAFYFHLMRQDAERQEMLDSLNAHPEWLDADSLNLTTRLEPYEQMLSTQMVRVADQLAESGRYEQALDTLASVLHKINVHHLKYNNVADDDTLTLTGLDSDSMVSREMMWIHNPEIIAVPEWMATVREELSIVYGAMGDKQASNYNHNVFYDILDATRQDMQMEQRHDTLISESRKLNLFILLFVIFAVVSVVFIVITTKRLTRNSRTRREKLSKCLDICTRLADGDNVDDEVRELFPDIEGEWENYGEVSAQGVKVNMKKIKPFDRELLTLIQVFNRWFVQNAEYYVSQKELQENVESEIYMHQRRMDENKRQHVERSTAISIVHGIMPFLDRAIHQVEKGDEYVDYELLREYVEKINAYNDVLGHWVKVRQGSVTLNVENFVLAPLLDTLRKGHRSFDNKQITLSIVQSDDVVKADKALTLFMMNTLLDNARKYTPEGGNVALTVDSGDSYVEISVADTGNGLTVEDQDMINNMKVYDSSQIGLSNDSDGQIKKNKGFGFGLMNCRGIIEKYRKSGRLFDVCKFGVESESGKGSRFFFRLPKGVIRNFCMICMLMFSFGVSAQTFENYIDSIYDANVAGDYEAATMFADYAIAQLNESYNQQTGKSEPLMSLYDSGTQYAELQWYRDGVDVDYVLITQLRNEVSLAALSLVNRELYRYNIEALMRMSKLMSQDPTIEEDCIKLKNANAGKNLMLILSGIILFVSFAVYFLLYYRHTLLPVFNMRQLAEFLRRMFSAEEAQLPRLLHEGVSSIYLADAVKVKLTNGNEYSDGDGNYNLDIPMTIEFEGEKHSLGSLSIALHDTELSSSEHIIMELISKFTSIHLFYASIKVEQQANTLELLEDQRMSAEAEQQRLHVQNMVMDNCLSTIKHETMYYPNRILQLIDEDAKADITEIRDVLKYYREVFGLLSENANRQLSRSIVKLQRISLDDLAKYARKSFEKQNKKQMIPVDFEVTGKCENYVRGDIVLLQYVLDMLLSLVFETKTSGKVELNFENSQGFIKFALSDSRIERSEEENSKLFYADSMYYDDKSDLLVGAQYLIVKQIIRDHDERLNHIGCRIYADGNKVVFTLPKV